MKVTSSFGKFCTAQRRIQQEQEHGERPSEQDVQPRLPADGADLAPRTQQNCVHTHRFSRAPGHNVQRAPSRVELQPGSREHAVSRRLSPVRECPIVSTATGILHVPGSAPHRLGLAVRVASASGDRVAPCFLPILLLSGNHVKLIRQF
ncbi:hypothetical protein V6N13_077322 [Hibiscus sabdariffa]|uniref:Uncharacterized protein n=1 Tax=Hibiscus sabdariffa TaxID=183260 RepID=A0ABR2CNH9_9ROSI